MMSNIQLDITHKFRCNVSLKNRSDNKYITPLYTYYLKWIFQVKLFCFNLFLIINLTACLNTATLSSDWVLANHTETDKTTKSSYTYNCLKNNNNECITITIEKAIIPNKYQDKSIIYYANNYIKYMIGLGHSNVSKKQLHDIYENSYIINHKLGKYKFKTVVSIKSGHIFYFTYSSETNNYDSQLPSFDSYWRSIINKETK